MSWQIRMVMGTRVLFIVCLGVGLWNYKFYAFYMVTSEILIQPIFEAVNMYIFSSRLQTAISCGYYVCRLWFLYLSIRYSRSTNKEQ